MRRTTSALWICLVALGAAVPNVARAGAWSPQPGSGYAKVWLKYLPGFSYADGEGESHDYGKYHELFLNAYGELGLAPGLAVSAHVPFFKFFSLEKPASGEQVRAATVGEPTFALRYQWLSAGRLAASVEAIGALNMTFVRGDDRDNEPYQFQDENGAPLGRLRIGANTWDVGGKVAVGYGFDRWYLAGDAGYLHRTNDYDDAVLYQAEVGGNLRGKWHGRFRIIGYHSLDTGEPAVRHNSPSGIGSGTRYTGFALELEYEFLPGQRVGLTSEGGGNLRRQTGGPVTTLYWAAAW